jgi:hypothetical protein
MHSLSVYKAGIEPCSGTNPNCRGSGKVRKAPGPDYITNEHIIHGGKTIVKWMCYIFNMMHTSEYVPFLYRHGIIVPLYKGNNETVS